MVVPLTLIYNTYKLALTKYFRIAADAFINRIFKGNTVTDRDSTLYRTSISTQFTVRRKPIKCARVAILHHTFTVFRRAGSHVSEGRADAVESPWAALLILQNTQNIFLRQRHSISQNITSNSHCFGHTDSRAGSPWNFKRVCTRVHRRKGGQSYHRPPVNSSEFLVFTCL